jgi:acyl-coenzyme A thioesterase PaaI-like protein
LISFTCTVPALDSELTHEEATVDSQVYGVWADAIAELISYRYLGCRSVLGDGFDARGTMPIRSDMRHEGSLLAAPVAIAMLDTAGIAIDRHWQLALTNVDVRLSGTDADVSTLGVDGSMTRHARSQVFTEARFYDDDDTSRTLGLGTADWAVIATTATGFEYIDPGPGVDDDGGLPPLAQAYGAADVGGRFVIEELTARLGGVVLHHGPILVTLEAAVLNAAGPGVRVEAFGVRFVRAGKRGPFFASARTLSDQAGTVLVRAEMTQDGDDANIVAVATVTLRRDDERISA